MQVSDENRRLVKFLVGAVLFFGWGTIQGALQAQKPIHDFLVGPATIIVGAHAHVGTLGWISLTLMAAIYFLLPVLGKPIAWPRLIDWIFWIFAPLLAVNSVVMITVGIRAGNAAQAGASGQEIGRIMGSYMPTIGILSIICGLVALLFVVQVLVSASRK